MVNLFSNNARQPGKYKESNGHQGLYKFRDRNSGHMVVHMSVHAKLQVN